MALVASSQAGHEAVSLNAAPKAEVPPCQFFREELVSATLYANTTLHQLLVG